LAHSPPTAGQAAIIRLAPRIAVKRGAFRPWLSRLVNLLAPARSM